MPRNVPPQHAADLRRRGETALSEFADYVQAQQAARRHPLEVSSAQESKESTAEVDTIIEGLGLDDDDDPATGIADKQTQSVTGQLGLVTNGDCDDEAIVSAVAAILRRRMGGVRDMTESSDVILDIGIDEISGASQNLDAKQWRHAHNLLSKAADKAGADCRTLLTRGIDDANNLRAAQKEPLVHDINVGPAEKDKGCEGKVLIRKRPEREDDVEEVRIAVVGNVDAGKSTMLGVLVKGGLDDGRGRARISLFRHKHEVESGRTSSVGMEIMGFNPKGEVVLSTVPGRKLTWEEIGHQSAKVVSFTDLAGHEKYLRTTVFGLLSSEPNYCLLMVAANNGLVGMSKEHLGIAVALNVPVMVVITKIDICPPNILKETLAQLTKILRSPGARKTPIFVKNREDAVASATQFASHRVCPIFQVSNVTGESLELVREFMNMVPPRGNYDATRPFEFHVNDTFSVPFVGTVVSGVVKSGHVKAGDTIQIGPDSLGDFMTTTIRSIERKRIRVPECSAGQSASFALKRVRRRDVRKGMVILPAAPTGKKDAHAQDDQHQQQKVTSAPPKAYREFIAEVLILSHATTIRNKYQAMLHVGPVSQTCSVIDIDRGVIRTGDRATVAFRFVQRPEFLSVGDRILFREGHTKGLGIVKELGYDMNKPLCNNASDGSGGPGDGLHAARAGTVAS